MKKIELVDFLKGYSIFTIVLYHLSQQLHLSAFFYACTLFGGTGAHLFILLSGFTLFLSYQNKKTNSHFLKKRFKKIYLPYALVIIISASLALFWPIFPKSIYAFLGNILLYNMFDNNIINTYGAHIWFIATIIQLYLVFFVLLKLKKILGNKNFFLISIFVSLSWSILLIYLEKADIRIWNSFFLQYLFEFVLGMILADWMTTGKLQYYYQKIKSWQLVVLFFLSTCLYAGLALGLGTTGRVLNDFPALIAYASLALLIFRLKLNILKKFFVYTGIISYSLYLTHFLVIELLIFFYKTQHIAFCYKQYCHPRLTKNFE